jgi:hypothetical protein
MGKITVKHYLNTNLKPYLIDGEKYYKVYFLLRYQSKNTKLKSLVDVEVTENDYSDILKDEANLINARIKNEVIFVQNIIKSIEKSIFVFDFKVFGNYWNLATYPIIEKFQEYIKWLIEYRYGRDINYYRKQNIEVLEDTLTELKSFVHENNRLINDEIYLGQILSKNIRKGLEDHLKQKKKISIWEVKNKDTDHNELVGAVRILYEPTDFNTIEFIVSRLTANGGFQMDDQEYSNGITSNWDNNFNKIIHSLSE